MYNMCLTQRTFPIGWKRQRKNSTNLKRYRTTSLASGENEAPLTRSKRSPNWLLTQSKEKGCTVVGFADDIALVTVAKTLKEITETSASVKYLGVLIDHRLSVKTHLSYAAAKASRSTAAISRMMAVVTSTILYAAPIWAEAMQTTSYSRQCKAVYRRCALRITSSFCTVGSRASGSRYYTDRPAGGRTKNWEHRKQDQAQQHDRGMAKEVEQCDHRAVDAQANSQSNPLAAEPTRTGLITSQTTTVTTGSIEDAEHALYDRYRFKAETTTVCNLTADNMISCMLENQSKWDAIANMAAGILKEQSRREQSRRIES
ncbi:uncharacterized protein [Drosophila suzukii]|uniref:Uncharacterized protein n=1 Tax=Drosophila suzukii TaxID=28584 RepID=A0ABM4TW67_DROSZ